MCSVDSSYSSDSYFVYSVTLIAHDSVDLIAHDIVHIVVRQ